MSERTGTSAEEALILITCACSGPDCIPAFMQRAKIRPRWIFAHGRRSPPAS